MSKLIKQRYQLLDKLGQGGFGAVYKAFDQVLDREVAIKLLNLANENQEEMVLRFQVESRVASRLEHQNIVRVYDFGRDDNGRCYLVSELLKGDSLHAHLKAKKKLPLSLAIDILYQVGSALELAHEQQTVHRDIKPPNIFLKEPMRGASFVKLLDFGIAKVMGGDESLTVTGQIMGTPHYMSPEQIVNIKLVDHRSDIYSLGVVFYQMVMGKVPFDDESYFTIMKQQMQSPMPSLKLAGSYPPELERDLNALLKTMTRKDVRKRVNQISEVLYKVQQIWSTYGAHLQPITTGVFRSITSQQPIPADPIALESIDQMLQPFEDADKLVDQILSDAQEHEEASSDHSSDVAKPAEGLNQVSPSAQPKTSSSETSAQKEEAVSEPSIESHETLDAQRLNELNSSSESSESSESDAHITADETPPAPLSYLTGGAELNGHGEDILERSPLSADHLETVMDPPSRTFTKSSLTPRVPFIIALALVSTAGVIWLGASRHFGSPTVNPIRNPGVLSALNDTQSSAGLSNSPLRPNAVRDLAPHSQEDTRRSSTKPSLVAHDMQVQPTRDTLTQDERPLGSDVLDLGVAPSPDQSVGHQRITATDQSATDQGVAQRGAQGETQVQAQRDGQDTSQADSENDAERDAERDSQVKVRKAKTSEARSQRRKRTKSTSQKRSSRPKRRVKRRRRAKLTGEIKLTRNALGYEVGQTERLRLPPSARAVKGTFNLGCATWVSKKQLKIKFNRVSSKCVIKYCYRRDCIQSSPLDVSKPFLR